MGLRKASAYSRKLNRPYTRKSSVKSKSYIKTVPNQLVVKFKMGNIKDYDEGRMKYILILASSEDILIRDNALEASRQHIHKILEEELQGQFYFEVKVYPHHIIREKKMLTGAGADRVQTGMAHSFGTNMGRAAIVKAGQEIFLVAVTGEKPKRMVYKTLEQIKSKLPGSSRILTEEKK